MVVCVSVCLVARVDVGVELALAAVDQPPRGVDDELMAGASLRYAVSAEQAQRWQRRRRPRTHAPPRHGSSGIASSAIRSVCVSRPSKSDASRTKRSQVLRRAPLS